MLHHSAIRHTWYATTLAALAMVMFGSLWLIVAAAFASQPEERFEKITPIDEWSVNYPNTQRATLPSIADSIQ